NPQVQQHRHPAHRQGHHVRAPHRPWLPPLPDTLLLPDLPEADVPAGPVPGADVPAVVYGLRDLPAEQRRRPLVFDLRTDGHLFVAGAPRSGRSQLLRTLAGAIAARTDPADVHLHALDCGGGALLALQHLPHTGVVVQRTQPERAQRLLARLRRELAERQEALGTGGFADVSEQRAAVPAAQRLPHLVLLLDRWEGFLTSLAEADGGVAFETVALLLREGASAGIHCVVTGDRQLLTGRAAALTDDKLVLRLADRNDYTLAGLVPREVPEDLPPGRLLAADAGAEAQVALLDADPTAAAQAAALQRAGA
ncbi:FtsK/SpoIIIE domain-containing protein, partial [Kineococcus glutinatus]|uniref:FtsK/SpoIIIE domain-containing protein n=1 Tax=Kineococcus glutinatus TaxID=1070872 RepID=UPI0031E4FCD5